MSGSFRPPSPLSWLLSYPIWKLKRGKGQGGTKAELDNTKTMMVNDAAWSWWMMVNTRCIMLLHGGEWCYCGWWSLKVNDGEWWWVTDGPTTHCLFIPARILSACHIWILKLHCKLTVGPDKSSDVASGTKQGSFVPAATSDILSGTWLRQLTMQFNTDLQIQQANKDTYEINQLVNKQTLFISLLLPRIPT